MSTLRADALSTSDIDGVQTLWVNAPGATVRASLMFRAGMADLGLSQHGWLHLLEHMALHGRNQIRRPVNGQVNLLTVSFDVQSEADDVADFIAEICGWLRTPTFDDLEHECRVLRAEEAQRGANTVSRHLLWRYGAKGPGLAGYDEFGLFTARPDSLRELAARVFTRENAVLALSGEPPRGLRIDLPSGARMPLPEVARCEQQIPAGFSDRVNGVALSGEVSRSSASTALTRTVQRELQARFRDQTGVGYSAWSSYEVVSADQAVLIAGIDVLEEGRAGLVDKVCTIASDLADRGCDPKDLSDDIDRTVREMREDPHGSWQPWFAARSALFDQPIQDREDLVAELQAVTVQGLSAAAVQLRSSLLVGVDASTPHGSILPWLDAAPSGPRQHSGRTFKLHDHPLAMDVLMVGSDYVQLLSGQNALVVRRSEIAAVASYADGARTFIREDGYQLTVEPTLWRDGLSALPLLDAVAPAELTVAMPARESKVIPQPRASRKDRLRYWWRWRWLTAGVRPTRARP